MQYINWVTSTHISAWVLTIPSSVTVWGGDVALINCPEHKWPMLCLNTPLHKTMPAYPTHMHTHTATHRPLLYTMLQQTQQAMNIVNTFENCPTTCFSILGGASWRRGSRAGRWVQRLRMLLRAFLDCRKEKAY